jgi:hypothetical protein
METNLKITIDQLKNYLGTGLKFEAYYLGKPFEGEMDYHNFPNFIDNSITSKLKFYRLSDLDKFIPELGFVPIEWFENHESIDFTDGNIWVSSMFKDGSNKMPELIPFGVYQKLFQWHFWPFGEEYFEQGLVIDKLKQK